MQLLLVHQNFPGQFRELAPAWLEAGHQLTAIGSTPAPDWPGLRYARYSIDSEPPSPLERARAVDHIGRHLHRNGLRPDVVIGHCGWGEALPLRQLFPAARLIVYPELWLTPPSLGIGFDPQLQLRPSQLALHLHDLQRLNLLSELAINQANAVIVPNAGQRASFPEALQPHIQVIPDGVNCAQLRPNPQSQLTLPCGTVVRAGDPLVTLVSRELEPLRGLRQALQAWPQVMAAEPQARLLLVGGHQDGYGIEASLASSHLEAALGALPSSVDRSRIHAVGRMAHGQLTALLQCSACHLGLSYPYTASWSSLEAMACAVPVISNPEHPLAADLRHGDNAWLVPFTDANALAEAILHLLRHPERRQQIGAAGRQLIEQHFSLEVALRRYQQLFEQLLLLPPSAAPATPLATTPTNHHDGAGATGAARDTRGS